MESLIEVNLANEIEKKDPPILASAQRSAAIGRAVKFLDALREQGHFVDPTNNDDSQVLRFLRFTRMQRPSTGDRPDSVRGFHNGRSARSVTDIAESVAELQGLIDEEYAALQTEVQELRSSIFASSEKLEEVKGIETPTTSSIETFNRRLQTQDFVCRSIAKTKGAGASRLKDSVRLSRLWV
jgi:hypothetical protein